MVDKALSGGRWSYEGPMETEFTERFAAYQDSTYGFCVTNGTVALELALRAADVGPGDEVIVPALTWLATASAVLAVGAEVVFADVDPDTYQIDPARVEVAITPRTRAVIPVHLYNRLADIDAIGAIAQRHGLVLIEDCAHAHGGIWRGRKTGSSADLACFSFQASKPLTCGEGGFVATKSERLAERVYGLKNCGRPWRGPSTRYVVGRNHRITEVQAAVLLAQFGQLDHQVEQRARNGAALDEQLATIDGIRPLARDPRVDRQSYYAYVFRYVAASFGGATIDAFRAALQAEGVPSGPTYGTVHTTELWGPGPRERWRVDSDGYASEVNEEAVVINQPLLLGTVDDIADIVAAVRKIRAHADELHQLRVEPATPASVAAPGGSITGRPTMPPPTT